MRKNACFVCCACVLVGFVLATPATAEPRRIPPELRPADGTYAHLFGTLSIGRGIRFNNPYRLATPMGDDAESLSWTATYVDLAASALLGNPEGLQHGVSLHLSAALDGVPQEVFTPSYIAAYALPPSFFVYGRAGLPIVVEPDTNVGYELAFGGAWLVTAGLGVTSELVGDLFYGAATQEKSVSMIPVLSLQIGVIVDYEILP